MMPHRPIWPLQRGAQRALALTALVLLAAGHYLMSRLPMPVATESMGRFEASAASELVLDQTFERPGLLLVFEGEVGDAVDLRFDRARLQEHSARLMRRLGVSVPAGDHSVSLLTGRADEAKTFLRIGVIPVPGQSSRLTLKSPREAGDQGLALVLRAEGARLVVDVLSAGDPASASLPPQRTLRLAGQTLPVLTGAVPLAMVATANSEIRLRIVPAVQGWDDLQRLALAPADHRDAAPYVFGMGVRAPSERVFTHYACASNSPMPLFRPSRLATGRCDAGEGRLRLVSFDFRPGLVSVQASGTAWMRKDNAVHTVDLVAWLKENPILAALIAAMDAAVLAWCKQVFFGGGPGQYGGQGPGESTHPNPP